jgi:hypothetical protein
VLFAPRKLLKGLVDQKKEDSSRELKEQSSSKGNEERSYKQILDLRAECVCIIWYQSLILVCIFQAGKARRNFNHASEVKGQTNTRSARGKGVVKRKG